MTNEIQKDAKVIEKCSKEIEVKKKYPLWRRMMRWLVYGVLGLVVFAVLVVFTVFLVPSLNRFMLDSYLPKARSLLKADIEVGSFSYNIFTGKLALEDFLYKKADPSESKPFVKANLIKARLNPIELITGIIHVKSVKIVDAQVYLRIAQGRLENLPISAPKYKAPQLQLEKPQPLKLISYPLTIDSVAFKDTQFELELKKPRLLVLAAKMEGKLSCDLFDLQMAKATLELEQVHLEYKRIKEDVEALKVEGEFSFADYSILADEITLKSDRLTTSLEFALKGLKQRKPFIQMKAPLIKADASIIKELFGQDLHGQILLKDFKLSGELSNFAGDAKIWSELLKYEGIELKKFSGRLLFQPCKVAIENMKFKSLLSKFKTSTSFNYCTESKSP